MKISRPASRADSFSRAWGWLTLSSPRDESFHLVVMSCIVASASPLPDGLRIIALLLLALQGLRVLLASASDSGRLSDDRVRLRRRLANKTQQPASAPSGVNS
jgi:hypothetical protein